ncbi:cyclic pyranopterin phosphate synthase [Rhodoblastus acidophilus]|uniref:GTP 3',8-cyclase MoaA n=1 Tax=Rhodoblastus acidophilus TaxID=1074 RepID=UPI002225388F|nr:GTP 3',8-cyclase MoaA [Rhodoblastus acidophilus]MCW2285399.1 cyclic pyranopterin phosphate synthase [Rhodoblastus acidophilus]MCW2334352.1 cyclic pyranopterin phosphate synthase [Rhodoblastus acidophilus]
MSASHAGPLVDRFARSIEYLRVSVTDRCNFRCTYCMSEHPTFLPKQEVLSLDEIDRIASAFVGLGVKRIRLTGGEPLTRRGIVSLVASLSRHLGRGLEEVTMTTNGSLLSDMAEDLAAAGLSRVNVSLDTLDEAMFARVSRIGKLSDVLAGLYAARRAGLAVRLNTVVQAGVNDRAIDDLIAFAHGRGMGLALIEAMPTPGVSRDRPPGVPLSEIRADLQKRWTLTDAPERAFGPARYVRVEETGGRLGFITPMSKGFCDACNRVRLTCDGRLVLCLGRREQVDLKTVLRGQPDDEAALQAAIAAAMGAKPRRHAFDHAERIPLDRGMWSTGG